MYVIHSTGSHSSIVYRELVGKIDLYNKYFCFVMCLGFSCCMLTSLPYSYIRYFIFDMGAESFYLFVPAWCVFVIQLNWPIHISRRSVKESKFQYLFVQGFHSIGGAHLDIWWHFWLNALDVCITHNFSFPITNVAVKSCNYQFIFLYLQIFSGVCNQCVLSIVESCVCILFAVHLRRRGYYKGFGYSQ